MSRLDVRCKVDLPVSVIVKDRDKGSLEKKARFKNLSLGGGFIDFASYDPAKKFVSLKYSLPGDGDFEILGEILRKDGRGIAARFINLRRDTKLKLWDYLRDNLQDSDNCPYCRNENIAGITRCNSCGWSLNFNSPDYMVQHEKESFIKRLAVRSEFFSIEDIQKVINFVDLEIFGIGRNAGFNERSAGSDGALPELFSDASLKEIKCIVEKQKLIEAIRKFNGNISRVAKVLEVSRPSVYSMKRKYGV